MKAKHRNALSWLPLGPKTPGDYEDQRNGAHHIMSSYHVMSHLIISCHHVTSHHIMSHLIVSSYHVTSYHVIMLHLIISRYMTLCLPIVILAASYTFIFYSLSSVFCSPFYSILSCTFQPLTLYCVAPQAMKSLISLEIDCIITVLMGLLLSAWMSTDMYECYPWL